MRNLELKIPPPVIGLSVALLMWCAAKYGWPQALNLTFLRSAGEATSVATFLALTLALAGAAFDLSGLIAFRQHQTTINPLKPGNTSSVVTTGVYRFTRNPMYVGMLLILCGWAVYLGHLIAIVLPPLFVLLINRLQIEPEERVLLARFGDDYAAYLSAVRRWV